MNIYLLFGLKMVCTKIKLEMVCFCTGQLDERDPLVAVKEEE